MNQAVELLEADAGAGVERDAPPVPRAHDTPQFGRRLTPEEIDAISDAIGRESWAGFMGRLILVLVPFYFGANLLGRRGPMGHMYSLTGYEELLAYCSMALGIGFGLLFFRSRDGAG